MLPDFDFSDKEGNTILHQAVKENNIEMVVSLLEKMKDQDKNIIDVQNNEGNTSFHLAILNNNNQIAQILDKAGADKTIRNNEGQFVEDVTEEEAMEVVNFKFNPMKCNSNSNQDFVNILNILSQLNSVPTIIINEDPQVVKQDIMLDNLLQQYMNKKNQKGGSKKKSHKINGIRYLN
jgi:ankyrin repeat protein